MTSLSIARMVLLSFAAIIALLYIAIITIVIKRKGISRSMSTMNAKSYARTIGIFSASLMIAEAFFDQTEMARKYLYFSASASLTINFLIVCAIFMNAVHEIMHKKSSDWKMKLLYITPVLFYILSIVTELLIPQKRMFSYTFKLLKDH